MDALILAGGETSPELAQATGSNERALIEIGARAMVIRVLETLRETPEIERIAVVGSDRVLDLCAATFPDLVRVPAATKMTQNFARGVNVLKQNRIAHEMRSSVVGAAANASANAANSNSPNRSDKNANAIADAKLSNAGVKITEMSRKSDAQILVCTCDIPLVSPQTFTDFIAAAREKNLELAYPIVRRRVSEAAFPTGKRTYAKLANGEFTGGNAVILPLRIAENINVLLETAYNARKKPLGLAKMLGPNLMWKFVRKTLSVSDVEMRASRVLDCRVGAIETTDATLSFDVDKVGDWRSAVNYLEKNSR